jgi:hypothetical protein
MFRESAFSEHPAPRRRDGARRKAASCGRTPTWFASLEREGLWECGDASPLLCLRVGTRCFERALFQSTPPRAVATAPAGKRPRAAALPHGSRRWSGRGFGSAVTRHRFCAFGSGPDVSRERFFRAPRPAPSRRRPPKAASCGRTPHGSRRWSGRGFGSAVTRHRFCAFGSGPDVSRERFFRAPRPAPSRRRPPKAASCGRTWFASLEREGLWECGDASPLFGLGRDPPSSHATKRKRPLPSRLSRPSHDP